MFDNIVQRSGSGGAVFDYIALSGLAGEITELERERERERERVNRLEEKLELGADFCVNVKTCSRIVQTDCTDPDLAALLTTL